MPLRLAKANSPVDFNSILHGTGFEPLVGPFLFALVIPEDPIQREIERDYALTVNPVVEETV